MAIKGKRKGGGGRRVASPPRPVMIPPRTPLLRRRSTRILIAVVLLGAAAAITVGVMAARNTSRRLEAARSDVRQFQTRVEAALTADGIGQDTGTGFVILPQLGQTLAQVQNDEEVDPEVEGQIEDWAEGTVKAADTIAGLDVGTSELSAEALRESATMMRQGLMLYSTLARNLGLSMDLSGRQKDRLVAQLQEQFAATSVVFDTGWQKLQALRAELGIPEPVPQQVPGMPGQVPGLPGGQVPGFPGGELPPGFDPNQIPVPEGEAPEGEAPAGEEAEG
ncbi:MAG TPA: hypothetical protein VM638_07075 [Actinomycetota bacterium]|nr:hypothetical protein [Actinomycetota bacterium]